MKSLSLSWVSNHQSPFKLYTNSQDSPHSVKTSNGELMESRQGILGAYRSHYQNLLRIKVGNTELEKTTETMVEKQFKALSMRETESHRKEITKGIVKKAIKMMRNKRAPDRRGWRAEWLKMEERRSRTV